MRLNSDAIQHAFEAHGRVYASQREWTIEDHARCWMRAAAAFEGGSYSDFEWLHAELKNRWQVFRSRNHVAPAPSQTWALVSGLDEIWRRRRLSDLEDASIDDLWALINSVARIKVMKSAPSVVAISKFLHFWNPRLFVIVDNAIMWQRVLSRSWLNQPIERERARLQALMPEAECPPSESCDLLDYLAVLTWSARLVRLNPSIPQLFGDYVRRAAPSCASDLPLDEYEAAAVEWLLLGLTEVPPEGVELD